MYDKAKGNVVLIRKQKPEWQKGRLNGIGGKVEDNDESIYGTMCREFVEETGVVTDWTDWFHFCEYSWKEGIVNFFYGANDFFYQEAKTVEKEEIVKVPVNFVINQHKAIIYNLKWLLPLAIDPSLDFSKTGPIGINE